jgi:hypothetical protein
MKPQRIMAAIELLAWPVAVGIVIDGRAWPMLMVAAPVGLWRMSIAVQELFRRSGR